MSGARERWLWLDGGRATGGAYLLPREVARRLAAGVAAEPAGRARHALQHLRKHLDGARVSRLERVAGERTLVLEAGESALVLRLSGSAPALTLAREGAPLATLGEGAEAWPPPPPIPEREWDRVDPDAFAASVQALVATGRSLLRAVLASCPGLGPVLARETDGSAPSFRALRERLAGPSPGLLAPGPSEEWHDADLAPAGAVVLAPVPLLRPPLVRLATESWLQAAALFLEARLRGARFERLRRAALDEARRALRRLEQLEANLASDLATLEDEDLLRRRGEALLAFGMALAPGTGSADLPDPREPEGRLLFAVDRQLVAPGQRRAAVRPRAAHRARARGRSRCACARPARRSRRRARRSRASSTRATPRNSRDPRQPPTRSRPRPARASSSRRAASRCSSAAARVRTTT